MPLAQPQPEPQPQRQHKHNLLSVKIPAGGRQDIPQQLQEQSAEDHGAAVRQFFGVVLREDTVQQGWA